MKIEMFPENGAGRGSERFNICFFTGIWLAMILSIAKLIGVISLTWGITIGAPLGSMCVVFVILYITKAINTKKKT